jgi:hypothetical protein
MSPTEDDLRAALRQGEGDSVSPDQTIALVGARRAKRRTTLLATAAAVVFVGALATGIGLVSDNSDSGSASSNQAVKMAPQTSQSVAGQLPGNDHAAAPASGGGHCPSSPTHQLLPGGGSPGQFGSGGKLFPKAVRTLVVCGYTSGPQTKPQLPGREVLTGSAAQQIVTSLENASKSRPAGACPDYEPAIQRSLLFVATATDGTVERQVSVTLSGPTCRVIVTNGTAVRYGWSAPTSYAPSLRDLPPTVGGSQPPLSPPAGGNQKNGSPAR